MAQNKRNRRLFLMGCIYNEKVKRSATPFIFLLVLFGILLVLISVISKEMGFPPALRTELDLVLTMIFLLAGYRVFLRSKDVYRYSIIADDLLIHRINGNRNLLVAKVKLAQIHSLECPDKKSELLKYLNKNYSEGFTKGAYCCKYLLDGEKKAFIFNPSKGMVNKLNTALKAL